MNAMQKLKHECNATTLHPSLPPRLNYKTKTRSRLNPRLKHYKTKHSKDGVTRNTSRDPSQHRALTLPTEHSRPQTHKSHDRKTSSPRIGHLPI